MIRSHYGGFFTPTLYGFFNFANPIPGGDLNAYLNTIADTFTGSAGNNVSDDNWTYAAAYFQDDYKPTGRLTLNLGVRYEVQSGPYSNEFDTLALRRLQELGYPTERQLDTNNIGPQGRLRLRRDGRRPHRRARRVRDLLRRDLPEHHALREVERRPHAAVLRLVVTLAVDAGRVRGQPRGDPQLVPRSDLCRADDPPHVAGPRAAVGASLQPGLLAPADAERLLRRGLHPLGGPRRDPPLADQHAAERQHPALARRCVRAGPRRVHRRGQPRPFGVRRPVRDGQGALGRAGVGHLVLRVDEDQQHRQRFRHAARRHHQRQLGP